jgi:hypothetical protein
MTRLFRAALFGLLWLAVSVTAFATPFVNIDFDLDDNDSDTTVFPQFLTGDPQQALDEWCLDPAHYVTLTQRLDPAPDIEDVVNTAALPGVQPVDLSEVTSTPTTLALSGAGLILLGMIRRRKN